VQWTFQRSVAYSGGETGRCAQIILPAALPFQGVRDLTKKSKERVLDSLQVQKLVQLVDESVRASREGVKHFVEPTPGVLAKAKSKRHNIIFGRRGSGKSSLLQKISADLTVDRTPIAMVDLETFKQHSYPDVLLSILIKSFVEVKNWLDTAATNPASKTSFWTRWFGAVPTKPGFHRETTQAPTSAR